MFLVLCFDYLQIVPYVKSVRIISVLDSSIFLRLIIILFNLTSICHSFLPSWVHRWILYYIFSTGPTSVFKSVDFNFQLWFFEHNYEELRTLSLIIQAWYVYIIDKNHTSPSLANPARVPTILVEFKALLPKKQLPFLAFAPLILDNTCQAPWIEAATYIRIHAQPHMTSCCNSVWIAELWSSVFAECDRDSETDIIT